MDAFINTHPVLTGMICIVIIIGAAFYSITLYRWIGIANGADGAGKKLTPTQKFILVASSPTIGNQYKCVIDIWDTHKSEDGIMKAKKLFEWGWGEFTYENAKNMAEDCLSRGYNIKYREYCDADLQSPEFIRTPSGLAVNPDCRPLAGDFQGCDTVNSSGLQYISRYTDYELQLLREMKTKYPKQGMLAWDLVRCLSVVGGAYMGGIMEYGEAAQIALRACRLLQENFSSWDDMVGSYTLGYQLWRKKKKTDRLKYYKKLKRTSWIYKIPWDTMLREEELMDSLR